MDINVLVPVNEKKVGDILSRYHAEGLITQVLDAEKAAATKILDSFATLQKEEWAYFREAISEYFGFQNPFGLRNEQEESDYEYSKVWLFSKLNCLLPIYCSESIKKLLATEMASDKVENCFKELMGRTSKAKNAKTETLHIPGSIAPIYQTVLEHRATIGKYILGREWLADLESALEKDIHSFEIPARLPSLASDGSIEFSGEGQIICGLSLEELNLLKGVNQLKLVTQEQFVLIMAVYFEEMLKKYPLDEAVEMMFKESSEEVKLISEVKGLEILYSEADFILASPEKNMCIAASKKWRGCAYEFEENHVSETHYAYLIPLFCF